MWKGKDLKVIEAGINCDSPFEVEDVTLELQRIRIRPVRYLGAGRKELW